MKTLRNTLTILFLATIPSVAKAQNVGYAYDAAGNRIQRAIVMNRHQAPQNSTKTQDESYSDMLAQKQIKIYPNPTSGMLKVEVLGLENEEKCQLNLFNSSGQQIISKQATSATTNLDISSRPNGIYILRISIGENETTWKIIKK